MENITWVRHHNLQRLHRYPGGVPPAGPEKRSTLNFAGPKSRPKDIRHYSQGDVVMQAVYDPAQISKTSVAVIEYISNTPHLEISIESALKFVAAGHHVTYFFIGNALPFVEFRRTPLGLGNNFLRRFDWMRKKSSRLKGLLASAEKAALAYPGSLHFRILKKLPAVKGPPPSGEWFQNVEQLCRAKYGDHIFGIGMMNSLTAITNTIDPIVPNFKRVLKRVYRSQILCYEWCATLFGASTYSEVVVFNGRFAAAQAIDSAAKDFGLRTWFHERGRSDNAGFSLSPARPHSAQQQGSQALARWENQPRSSRRASKQVALSFFSVMNRQLDVHGNPWFAESSWAESKNGEQQTTTDRLPIVTFFTSTEGEFTFLVERSSPTLFRTQREAIEHLVAQSRELRFHLVIRIHPNVSNFSKLEKIWWKKLTQHNTAENVSFVSFDNPVDSFHLLDKSDLIITWHSTIALHAVRSGKPCVTLFDAFYRHAGADLYFPNSLDELDRFLLAAPPAGKESSVLAAAFHLVSSQHAYQFFKPSGFFSGEMFGFRSGG